jgi:hypothetical protein
MNNEVILSEGQYEIRKARQKHRQSREIILSHVRNFYEKDTHLSGGAIFLGSSKYTWGRWQFYFYKVLVRFAVPFHYFIEQVGNDFVVFVAQPEYSPSYFLTELADNNIIPTVSKSSIIVAIGEDLSLENPSKRMYQQLCFRIIVPLMQRNRKYIDYDNIKYIDDIIDWGKYNDSFQKGIIKYELKPAKYFDRNLFDIFYRRFMSSISQI